MEVAKSSHVTYDVRAALKAGIGHLREARVSSFTLAAELLLLHVLGRERTWLYTHPEEILAASDAKRYFDLISRRGAGEPVQHLTGHQEFWGLDFAVNPDVLIPRPETEHVIEVTLDRLALREVREGRPQTTDGQGLFIADVGTGSGCIAVALAKELPRAHFYAGDISAAALTVAKRNAERHNVAGRIIFSHSNVLEGAGAASSSVTETTSQLFDAIVSNPPYIGRREAQTLAHEVRDHEPATALFGGEEGYELYAALVAQSAQHLRPGGLLVLELGYNNLPAVQPLLGAPQWSHVSVTNDLAGIPRVIAAELSTALPGERVPAANS
jgi:release factor glutamine methyltransferase